MKLLPAIVAFALTTAFAGAASAHPVRVLVPCSYPHGWNSTDASRELRGIPNGEDHQCLVEYDRARPNADWRWRHY